MTETSDSHRSKLRKVLPWAAAIAAAGVLTFVVISLLGTGFETVRRYGFVVDLPEGWEHSTRTDEGWGGDVSFGTATVRSPGGDSAVLMQWWYVPVKPGKTERALLTGSAMESVGSVAGVMLRADRLVETSVHVSVHEARRIEYVPHPAAGGPGGLISVDWYCPRSRRFVVIATYAPSSDRARYLLERVTEHFSCHDGRVAHSAGPRLAVSVPPGWKLAGKVIGDTRIYVSGPTMAGFLMLGSYPGLPPDAGQGAEEGGTSRAARLLLLTVVKSKGEARILYTDRREISSIGHAADVARAMVRMPDAMNEAPAELWIWYCKRDARYYSAFALSYIPRVTPEALLEHVRCHGAKPPRWPQSSTDSIGRREEKRRSGTRSAVSRAVESTTPLSENHEEPSPAGHQAPGAVSVKETKAIASASKSKASKQPHCRPPAHKAAAKAALLKAAKLLDEEKYDQALAEFQRAVKLDPDSEGAAIQLATMYTWIGRYEEAEDLVRAALQRNANEPALLSALQFIKRERAKDAGEPHGGTL